MPREGEIGRGKAGGICRPHYSDCQKTPGPLEYGQSMGEFSALSFRFIGLEIGKKCSKFPQNIRILTYCAAHNLPYLHTPTGVCCLYPALS